MTLPDAGSQEEREQIRDDHRVEDLPGKNGRATNLDEADAVSVRFANDAILIRMHKFPLPGATETKRVMQKSNNNSA